MGEELFELQDDAGGHTAPRCRSSRGIGALLSAIGFGWPSVQPSIGLRGPCGSLPTGDAL